MGVKKTYKVQSGSHDLQVEAASFETSASVSAFEWNTDGFSSVSRDSAGVYQVTMAKNYTNMAVNATMEGSSTGHIATVSGIDESASGGSTFNVYVTDNAGSLTDVSVGKISCTVAGVVSSL